MDRIFCIFAALLLALCQAVPTPFTVNVGVNPTATATLTDTQPASALETNASTRTLSTVPNAVFSPAITIAPVASNKIELRQKCFNDQGFSVDCATWTGYYYTWGPASNPYEGGPGEGNGNPQGTTYTTVYVPSRASRTISLELWAALCVGFGTVLVLWLLE